MVVKRQCLRHYGSVLWMVPLYIIMTSVLVAGYDSEERFDSVTEEDIVKSVDQAAYHLDMLKTHETNIRSKTTLDLGTPFHGVVIAYAPEPESLEKGRAGWMSTRTTQHIVALNCIGLYDKEREECVRKASSFNLTNTLQFQDMCEDLTKLCTPEEYNATYRSPTGHCNHKVGHQGESFTGYIRLINPVYTDVLETPRRAVNKRLLPNSRTVSGSLVQFDEVLHDRFTMAVLQWGQFLEQDLSRPALSPMYHYNTSFKCCRYDGFTMIPRYVHKFCSPISLSSDKFYTNKYKYCMSYVRSFPALRPDCSLGPQEQLNQATHYHDGSQIYGSTSEKNRRLRAGNGRYKTTKIGNEDFLPLSPTPRKDCMLEDEDAPCFLSGDPRVNFEPQVIAMHTLWAREHNRLAAALRNLNNTGWRGNDFYEEAKRIVVAMMQHITYEHWAPTVLASKYQTELNKYTSYRENVNPAVLNTLGVAVLRSLKSMYPKNIALYSEDRKERNLLKLRSLFYKPEIFDHSDVFDAVVRGIATQSSGGIDEYYDEDLINRLYNDESDDFGYDVLALDIERGRDHGIAPYNSYRTYLGFKHASSFEDFGDVMRTAAYEKLSKIYTNPTDVDLIVGGIMEEPMPGSLFGPTFSWLLTNQLIRTRQGDKYFYTNSKQPKPFTDEQLQEIKKITLARIMCDNSDIETIQPDVFQKISESNPLVGCASSEIPSINVNPWIEAFERPHVRTLC